MRLFKKVSSFILVAALLLAPTLSFAGNYAFQQVPPGTMLMYGGVTAPTGYVICDGSSYPRTGAYAALYAAIGTAWGAADGSHFNVPDMRGRFPRGVDGGIARDPDRAARTESAAGGNTGDAVGSIQGYAAKAPTNAFTVSDPGNHTHQQQINNPGTPNSGPTYQAPVSATLGTTAPSTLGGGAHVHTVTGGDNETRPVNAGVNFIIKQ